MHNGLSAPFYLIWYKSLKQDIILLRKRKSKEWTWSNGLIKYDKKEWKGFAKELLVSIQYEIL